MRPLLVLLLACALPALEVGEIRHLLARAGLGAAPADFAAFAPLTWEQAVDRLLAPAEGGDPATPDWAGEPPLGPAAAKALDEEGRRALREQERQRAAELKAWWLGRLVAAEDPLRERMTLIWQGHFTSSLQKVNRPQDLLAQHLLLRRHALGDLRALAHAIARDPAMIRFLDNQTNRRGHPNENFARELFELFLLGEGSYGEGDIAEAARAFAGWHVQPATGRFRIAERDEDRGRKTVFGVTGDLDGDQVIDLALARPSAAPWLVGRLWRELVDGDPDPAAIADLAALLQRDWRIRPVVRAILLHPRFRQPHGTLVKSPIDVVAGTARLLDWRPDDLTPWVNLCRDLGQDLFNPPNVKGWADGVRWITATSLLRRRQALEVAMARLEGAGKQEAARMAAIASDLAHPGGEPRLDPLVAAGMPDSVLAAPAATPSRATTPLGRLRAALLDPAYQVK